MFRIRTRASDGRSLNPGDVLSIVLPTETFPNRQRKRNDDLSNYPRRCFSASNTSPENPKTRPQEHPKCAQGRIWTWQAMTRETVSTNRSRSTIVNRFPASDFRNRSRRSMRVAGTRRVPATLPAVNDYGLSNTSFRDASISTRFRPVNCWGSDQVFIG